MPSFVKESLEAYKYADLVKIAKEHDVYRRYAPKVELVEKLLALNNAPVETLEDISMPSIAMSEESDSENTVPDLSWIKTGRGRKTRLKDRDPAVDSTISLTHQPLSEKVSRNSNASKVPTSALVLGEANVSSPNRLRRSLAGPASSSKSKLVRNGRRLKHQNAIDRDSVTINTSEAPSLPPRRLTRQKTFDIDSPQTDVKNNKNPPALREGTFNVDQTHNESLALNSASPFTHKLKREGTFEVVKNDGEEVACSAHLSPLETAFEVSSKDSSEIKTPSTNPRSALKSSILQSSQYKKSHKKSPPEKLGLRRKAPDFQAIHKRLFGKMESLVDSKRKVLERANSLQKRQVKPGNVTPSHQNVKRKLLSPKAGKTKLPLPKPVFPQSAPNFSSNVVAIQRRTSNGKGIAGVSKLQSPRIKTQIPRLQSPSFNIQQQNSEKSGVGSNRFGFTMGSAAPRKDAIKACVIGKKPIKRESPMTKAKQTLHSVRLNKRFELQMKHRLAKQSNN